MGCIMSALEIKYNNLMGRMAVLSEMQKDIQKKKEEILEEAIKVLNEANEKKESWVQPYGS